MGEIKRKEAYLVRGREIDSGRWVYGNYVQMLIDSVEHAYIYPFPVAPNTGNHAYTPQPYDIEPESVSRFTGMCDEDGDDIYEGDLLELPNGQTGKVVYHGGAWGVSTRDYIDWDSLEEGKLNYRESHFFYEDHFISFIEIADCYCPEDASEDILSAVRIIDEPKPLLWESPWGGSTEVLFSVKSEDDEPLSLSLVDTDGLPFTEVTVDVPETAGCALDEAYVKDWGENEGMYRWLMLNEIGHPTKKTVRGNYVSIPQFKFDLKKVRQHIFR